MNANAIVSAEIFKIFTSREVLHLYFLRIIHSQFVKCDTIPMGIGFYPIQEKAERIYSILFYLVRELKSIGVMVKIFPLIALNIVVKNFFSL